MSKLLKIRPRHEYPPQSGSHAHKTFDADSGLVYSEVIARAGPMTAEWQWKSLGSVYEVKTFRTLDNGSASLANIAMRSVVANISSLTFETLNDIPWVIGKQIWQRLLA